MQERWPTIWTVADVSQWVSEWCELQRQFICLYVCVHNIACAIARSNLAVWLFFQFFLCVSPRAPSPFPLPSFKNIACVIGINAKMRFFSANERSEGEGMGKGNWKWSFGRNGKNRKRPSRESNPGPQQTRLMLYHWATETSDITASLFEILIFILSVLPPLHNIGIIQCPQLTNLLRSGNPSRSPLCITQGLKE